MEANFSVIFLGIRLFGKSGKCRFCTLTWKDDDIAIRNRQLLNGSNPPTSTESHSKDPLAARLDAQDEDIGESELKPENALVGGFEPAAVDAAADDDEDEAALLLPLPPVL